MSTRASCIMVMSALLVLLALPASAAPASWKRLALLVGQNETDREKAIASLRQLKDLDQKLIDATATADRALALDVMSALGMRHLVPRLLELTRADRDGFLTLTLNSLMDEKNAETILSTYKENLRPDKLAEHSPASIVAMLEPLGRLRIALGRDTLTALLLHDMPEMRSSALIYLRLTALDPKFKAHTDLVPLALKSPAYQVRLQALYLIDELREKRGIPFYQTSITKFCSRERNPVVLQYCRKKVRR